MSEPSPAAPLGRGWLLVLLSFGFVLGVIGGFLQEHRLTIGSVPLPWASVLIVATLAVSIRALSLNLASRLGGALFFAGWLIATGLLAIPNPSGDIVFTADLGSAAYVVGGCLLGGISAAWPLRLETEQHPGNAGA